MKAAVVHAWGGPDVLTVETVPDPVPGPGEVVVRLRAASLNWHDAIVRSSGRGADLPSILGMDGAGVREDTGEEVVVYPCLDWGPSRVASGPGFSILGDRTDGTYAEAVAVPEANLVAKPEHLSWEEAAALPCAALTAYRALFTRAGVQAGETVLVLGAGSGVSTYAVTFAAAAGATVLVTSSSTAKIDAVRALGAHEGFLYTEDGWTEKVVAATGGGVDVIVDGAGATLGDSLACLKPGGRVAVFGASAGPTATVQIPALYFGQFSILGTTLGSPEDFRDMLGLVAEHRVRPVLDSTYPLSDIVTAHTHLEARRHVGKLVVVPDE
jgi:NADPH:quinone reductase-like Zn-dependent oxidoreductase